MTAAPRPHADMPGVPEGLRGRPVYLDYNATTPVDARVSEVALRYLSHEFGNPSSSHAFGAEPHQAVEQARLDVAGLLGCGAGGRRGDVVFTGSGSEANLLALRGSVLSPSAPRSHVITQATEHDHHDHERAGRAWPHRHAARDGVARPAGGAARGHR